MALAETIKIRRIALRMSQSDLAKKAGVSQQLVTALENSKISSTKFIPEIALALNCGVRDLDPRFGVLDTAELGPLRRYEALADLPILGCDIHVSNEMSIVLHEEPVDFVDRPAPLRHVRNAYALIVPDQNMSPELQSGDIVFVNPHLPPKAGASCIFYLENSTQRLAKIRHLIGFSPSHWQVGVWQRIPDAREEPALDRTLWQSCHRIVARFCNR